MECMRMCPRQLGSLMVTFLGATRRLHVTCGRRARIGDYNVTSSSLVQLEGPPPPCYPPRLLTRKVTVLGAGSDVGRIASLFLKQQSIIRTLALYDTSLERNVMGLAHDLAHIDTSVAVEAYQTNTQIQHAVRDADVILVCGGEHIRPPCCNNSDYELFFRNMPSVKSAAHVIAKFCPHALVCIQTPPVDATFTLVKHTFIDHEMYDAGRLFGLNSVNAMRANQLYCDVANKDPAKMYAPVVLGTGVYTRVPVFSVMDQFVCQDATKIDEIRTLVREADEMICRVKCNGEQGFLSNGFAIARAVTNIVNGMNEKPALIDSAIVDQPNPSMSYGLETCATPLVVGPKGIIKTIAPQLNDKEKMMLENSQLYFENMLELGRCYALGEDYVPICEFPCWPCECAPWCAEKHNK